jgi:hypothetical protein
MVWLCFVCFKYQWVRGYLYFWSMPLGQNWVRFIGIFVYITLQIVTSGYLRGDKGQWKVHGSSLEVGISNQLTNQQIGLYHYLIPWYGNLQDLHFSGVQLASCCYETRRLITITPILIQFTSSHSVLILSSRHFPGVLRFLNQNSFRRSRFLQTLYMTSPS